MTADLERNTQEQERIGAEVAALQEQLRALQHDQTLLVNLQQTLGSDSPTATGPDAAQSAVDVPSVPRQASAKPTPARRKKAVTTKSRKTAAKSPETKTSTSSDKQPTLVALIRGHLAQQPEPRSAAEIASELAQAHPERNVKPTVVRTTVEGLVAKGHVRRAKQGSSVFYTASTAEAAGDSAEQSGPASA
ncbi:MULTISPECIES: BlaI/MecI/CopY family transcriptional regulator [unclassified Streptomyces]|uniref:BlaI/MecI/CopY family transcriptional regulator n=1 Tax=unclassified Streptomyces TaxID=2593676 RepID=UPI002DDC6759|nr:MULTISPECIES: BlaI/MecI/CopY family transcriptional regulator [unclassified Streptomyces]WSA90166.1 BlaI/MecI/CopY family transcriptional regulator [Streptomyces sp. NBC_01795]WSB74394.1 BlaI/MecI/CopY family transcriptional regulator [Streptomyces sp. NBC_01775]WSS17224.1 BlaI/MecI/CopY family transcriptional regulator [Streptomyces sp. NBC_01186]WSS45968.1 BlaI/MecI/CopY family transcriptional regulator [Streptomyces sp. NBC_01187]